MLDMRNINARIEPGCFIRENVSIGDNAVIMMGAVINIGAKIGEGSMIDMGAVLGGRAEVGKHCHVGAGAVLAGVIEPPSASPVILEDDVLIGANAVVIEGVKSGESPVFTTMWTMLGYPPVRSCCRCGSAASMVFRLLQGAEDSVRSPLCDGRTD